MILGDKPLIFEVVLSHFACGFQLCAEMPEYCDWCDSWMWVNGEHEDWEETWEPIP
jgi:hypothetical protein